MAKKNKEMGREERLLMTVEDFDQLKCAEDGEQCCSHELVLESACHPGSGVIVAYAKHRGILGIFCSICDEHIVSIEIGRKIN